MLLCLAEPVDNFLGLQRLTWMVGGVNLNATVLNKNEELGSVYISGRVMVKGHLR